MSLRYRSFLALGSLFLNYLHIQKGLSYPSVGYAQSSIYISTCACVILCMASLFASTNARICVIAIFDRFNHPCPNILGPATFFLSAGRSRFVQMLLKMFVDATILRSWALVKKKSCEVPNIQSLSPG